jgi:hypothetical protein
MAKSKRSKANEASGGEEGAPLLEAPIEEPSKPSTLLTVCPFILGNEFCERYANAPTCTSLFAQPTLFDFQAAETLT